MYVTLTMVIYNHTADTDLAIMYLLDCILTLVMVDCALYFCFNFLVGGGIVLGLPHPKSPVPTPPLMHAPVPCKTLLPPPLSLFLPLFSPTSS